MLLESSYKEFDKSKISTKEVIHSGGKNDGHTLHHDWVTVVTCRWDIYGII